MHPKALILSKFGRGLIYSAYYQQHVCALVIDEAHCILEWYDLFYYIKLFKNPYKVEVVTYHSTLFLTQDNVLSCWPNSIY